MRAAPEAAATTEPGTSAEPVQRLCGRCRCVVPDDPTLFFQTDWVLCSPCQAVLLPGRFPGRPEWTWPTRWQGAQAVPLFPAEIRPPPPELHRTRPFCARHVHLKRC